MVFFLILINVLICYLFFVGFKTLDEEVKDMSIELQELKDLVR